MEIFDAIKTRRSCRKFSKREIEREKLDIIIEAGRYAPSGGNNQTGHLIVITNRDELKILEEAVKEQFSTMTYDKNTYKSLVNSIRQSKTGNYVFHYAKRECCIGCRRGFACTKDTFGLLLWLYPLLWNDRKKHCCWNAVKWILTVWGINDRL